MSDALEASAPPAEPAAPSAAPPPTASSSSPAAAPKAAVHVATADLLGKLARYAEGEAELSAEDYRLLQAMNLGCAGRYGEMAASAEGLVAFADRLQGQCAELMPQLGRIDAIAQQVHELEGAVGQLDAYSRRLEAKFDALAESAKAKTYVLARTTITRNATSSGAVGATPRPAASRSSSASWQSSVIACSVTANLASSNLTSVPKSDRVASEANTAIGASVSRTTRASRSAWSGL